MLNNLIRALGPVIFLEIQVNLFLHSPNHSTFQNLFLFYLIFLVHWLTSPTWSSDRITARARKALADRFTVAVGNDDEAATCPRCGESTVEQSTFGPSRCRAIHRCSGCAEVVEVLRA